jgi:hypothetical protein
LHQARKVAILHFCTNPDECHVSYNPNILNDILRARSLTRSELSRRLDIREDELQRELTREPGPRQGLLNDIAKELALPAFVFFMSRPPALHDVIPDFRSKNPSRSAKVRETIQSIQLAEAVQRVAVEGRVLGAKVLPNFEATKAEEVDEFALAMRAHFGITVDDQVSSRDAKAFYVLCRRKIEDEGIFVLQDSFPESDGSGFCGGSTRLRAVSFAGAAIAPNISAGQRRRTNLTDSLRDGRSIACP